jgi:hypothetical protein
MAPDAEGAGGQQRSEDRDHRIEGAAREIGPLHAREDRSSIRRAVLLEYAGEGEIVDVMARPVSPRSALTIATDRAIDQ